MQNTMWGSKRNDKMKALLAGKNAIVTGSNRGIGNAIVEKFAFYGANVWACARKSSEKFSTFCHRLEVDFDVWVKPVYFDMEDTDAMKEAVKRIRAEKLVVDILVNNAGVVPENQLFQMVSLDEMKRIFSVNFFAAMQLTQLVSKMMLRCKSGSVINMASIAALDGEPAQVEYVASKAALIGATKKLASELGAYGIRVNAIAPGVTKTEMLATMQKDLQNKIGAETILKRLADPKEIADVVVFLASNLSRYITGQVLRVDGGMRR